MIHTSPLVNVEVVANYSLLYKVDGQNQSIAPYLLSAHLDVVPTENQNWKHSPFAAEVEDRFIYARGSLDDKHNLFVSDLSGICKDVPTPATIKKIYNVRQYWSR